MPAASAFAPYWQQYVGGTKVVRATAAKPAPEEWPEWLGGIMPAAVSRPMGERHIEFWNRAWAIDVTDAPAPWFGIWPREGGKTTTIECAVVALGCRGARRYVLYVRKTQKAADDNVSNIGEKLSSAGVEEYYPEHARPLVMKFGGRSWRRNRLRTAGGLIVDAVGLDVKSIRGLKVGDLRPDMIVYDDIDDELDTPVTLARKVKRIRSAILPAGDQHCWHVGIQNLVIEDGFFTQLTDGRADYLADRIVSGPHPAVKGLKVKMVPDRATRTKTPKIVGGRATWAGQPLEVCQRNMRLWGLDIFMREAQHDVGIRRQGLVLNYDVAEHLIDSSFEKRQQWAAEGQLFCGIDFQAWRFAWVLFGADKFGTCRRLEELFSQREELSVRAFRIHYALEQLGLIKYSFDDDGVRIGRPIKKIPMWGDSANPQDILELNAAWKRGWRNPADGRWVKSGLRVAGVGKDAKLRRAAVEKINDNLGKTSLLFCRDVGADHKWLLGYSTTSAGKEMTGSRFLWELEHWSYPVLADGKVDVKGDPDDQSADGADYMAAARYALISFWTKAAAPEDDDDFDINAPDVLQSEADRTRRFKRGKSKRSGRLPSDAYDNA